MCIISVSNDTNDMTEWNESHSFICLLSIKVNIDEIKNPSGFLINGSSLFQEKEHQLIW